MLPTATRKEQKAGITEGKIMFDAQKVKQDCIKWIRDFFEKKRAGL